MLTGLLISAMMLFCILALAFTARMDRDLSGPLDLIETVEGEVPLPVPGLETI